MGVLFEQCHHCGSTKTNSGLLSGLCPNCGEERELVIGPGGNNYGEGVINPEPLTDEEKAELHKVDKAKLREALGLNIRRVNADDLNTLVGPNRGGFPNPNKDVIVRVKRAEDPK